MPEFRYSVIDAKGQPLSGIIEAENEEICRKIIAQRGLYCLSVAPTSLAFRSINFSAGSKLKTKKLSVFCRQFSTMLAAGISIIKSLDILHNQESNQNFKSILKKIYESVQRGQSLSSALIAQKVFPDIMVSMVESGEVSGSLDQVMDKLAFHFEKSVKTDHKVKGAMMYPIILSVLTVSIVILLMVFVLPTFIKMFEANNTPLPLPTKILVGLSNSITGYWYIYLITISVLYISFVSFIRNEKGRLIWDKFKTTAPMVGKLNVIILSARFARTLATMMQSGIPLIKALEITAKVIGNKHFETIVNEAINDIKKGVSLSVALKKTKLFPIMLMSMISIGEESGALDDVLSKTANFYDEEADSAVTRLVGLLEPLMIVIMALVVGFIVVSIILPMYGSMM